MGKGVTGIGFSWNISRQGWWCVLSEDEMMLRDLCSSIEPVPRHRIRRRGFGLGISREIGWPGDGKRHDAHWAGRVVARASRTCDRIRMECPVFVGEARISPLLSGFELSHQPRHSQSLGDTVLRSHF